jgi:N-carbamoyl-L-amino-acid hydrolase
MPAPNVLEINPERLWETLERSAEIGRFRDVGLRRLALSAEDKEMRDLFVDWAKKAGCTVEIDRLGNIFARRAGSDPSLPPVAIGSHLDTQICGGRYDGILGVLCGLEVVRTLNDRGLATKRGIEVICWTNEEGARFSPPMMGSMAFAGVLPPETVLATKDDDGVTVEQALDRIGYAGPAPLASASSMPISNCTSSRRLCSIARRSTSASWSAATRPGRSGSPSRAIPAMPAARRWRCARTRWSARAM